MTTEQDILATIAQCLPNPGVLDDDAYVDDASGLIYTSDMLVEDRHFSRRWASPVDIGWKAAAVNISDIAAEGGELKYLLVNLALPDSIEPDFVADLYRGLQTVTAHYGGHIIGGDTVAADKISISVTAIGFMPPGHTAGRRSLARMGDHIVVTGPFGLSAVGLSALQQDLDGYPEAREAHLHPRPAITEGLLFSKLFPRFAMMDASDGLADALLKIAHTSQVRIEIAEQALWTHAEVSRWAAAESCDSWEPILYGGEDYHLVASVPVVVSLPKPFQVIGRVVEGPSGAILKHADGHVITELSAEKTYQHFSGQGPTGKNTVASATPKPSSSIWQK